MSILGIDWSLSLFFFLFWGKIKAYLIPRKHIFLEPVQSQRNKKRTHKEEFKMGESDNNGKVSREEEEQPLSPASRLFHSPRFNCYIIAILGCNTKFKPDVIKSGLEQTLLKHPRFSSKLVRETILFFCFVCWCFLAISLVIIIFFFFFLFQVVLLFYLVFFLYDGRWFFFSILFWVVQTSKFQPHGLLAFIEFFITIFFVKYFEFEITCC